jgi:hypothetical protein
MKVGTPTLTPGSGEYTGSQNVTVSTVTSGAVLHYTTNGVEPTESSPVVASGSTVSVDKSMMLMVKGWKSGGWTTSDTGVGSYTINLGTATAPALSPLAGTYTAIQSVTLSTTTAGALIRYTLDGTEPTWSSPFYKAPLTVDETLTLKAKAYKTDWIASSRWKASILSNTGAWYRRIAYFSRAERALKEAWELAKKGEDRKSRVTADAALGQLLDLHMQFGHQEQLEALLGEAEGRDVLGGGACQVFCV